MKVAVVTHNVVRGDGQGRVNLEFVRFLLERGHEVEIFADRLDESLVESGAIWRRIRPRFDKIDLLKVWRFKRLADRALVDRAGEFDVVIACGVVLGVEHDLNVAHFVHGTWLESPYHASKVHRNLRGAYQWLFSFLNARWEQRVFSQATHVGAVSRMVADELRQIGVPTDKIAVLNNGVDLEEFQPGREDRVSLGLPEGVALGLFVGDIRSAIKNLDAVIRSMHAVPGMHLAVAGRVAGSPYQALAVTEGVADRVHFLDFRSDIAHLMRACDFFVLVSRRDSCPLVVLEAIASGLPVVTSRTVGNHDIVEDCCGYVIDTPDSHEQLVIALRSLIDDPALRSTLSKRARDRALEHSWEKMSARYLELLTSATSRLPVDADG